MSKKDQLDIIRNYLSSRFQFPDEQVDQMLPSFILTLGKHMDGLESALQQGDLTDLGRKGHTMKGALLNLGLHEYADIALEIEVNGRDGKESVDYASLVQRLRDCLKPLLS